MFCARRVCEYEQLIPVWIRVCTSREVVGRIGGQGISVEDALDRGGDGEEMAGAIRHRLAGAITAFWWHGWLKWNKELVKSSGASIESPDESPVMIPADGTKPKGEGPSDRSRLKIGSHERLLLPFILFFSSLSSSF